MKSLVFRSIAAREYDEAARWYESHQAGLGIAFETAVQETISRILARPEQFVTVEGSMREVRVERFPYCIYYRIRGETIVVLAEFHHARDPAKRVRRR